MYVRIFLSIWLATRSPLAVLPRITSRRTLALDDSKLSHTSSTNDRSRGGTTRYSSLSIDFVDTEQKIFSSRKSLRHDASHVDIVIKTRPRISPFVFPYFFCVRVYALKVIDAKRSVTFRVPITCFTIIRAYMHAVRYKHDTARLGFQTYRLFNQCNVRHCWS
jgi:hypothetical protein